VFLTLAEDSDFYMVDEDGRLYAPRYQQATTFWQPTKQVEELNDAQRDALEIARDRRTMQRIYAEARAARLAQLDAARERLLDDRFAVRDVYSDGRVAWPGSY
jgi:hypothetical protein